MKSGTAARVAATLLIGGAVGLLAVGVSGAFETTDPSADRASLVDSPIVDGSDPGATTQVVEVWKSPTCGCCGGWVEHMRANGFTVEVHDVADPRELAAVKADLGITSDLASCHTARIGEAVFEGHVPADAVRRFLASESGERGLAVPGMPIGSPGMEIPGRAADAYEVLAFDDEGSVRVFEER